MATYVDGPDTPGVREGGTAGSVGKFGALSGCVGWLNKKATLKHMWLNDQ